MSTLETAASSTPRSVYLPQPARVLSVEKMTDLETFYELELESGRPLGHRAGQFVQVSVMGVGECPISICSSPTRGPRFQLCIRRAGEVTGHIHRVRTGDVLGIRGPYGNGFDLKAMYGKHLLVVTGGLGLAPARSVIQHVLDERSHFGDFHLLYGAVNPASRLFLYDLARWRERDDVNLLETVDRPDPQWRGKSGVVTTLFKELPPIDPHHAVAVVIGPPVMFKFVFLELNALHIPLSNIFFSLERRMKCGIGKCGHCLINHVYVCREGPVFSAERVKHLPEALK